MVVHRAKQHQVLDVTRTIYSIRNVSVYVPPLHSYTTYASATMKSTARSAIA